LDDQLLPLLRAALATARASETRWEAPRTDTVEPLRGRIATIIGVARYGDRSTARHQRMRSRISSGGINKDEGWNSWDSSAK
jgi:hypothetical protein